jgi:hypothetical protein
VHSSTDTGPHAWLEAARDTRHLMAFRARTVRRRGAASFGLAVVVVLTAVFAVVPSRVDLRSGGSAPLERALTALESNLGAAFAGFLLLAVGAAMGSGGGRELLSRSEAAVHPISPVTEHLGALLLAPVNLAWMVQAWSLLAVTALVTPPQHLVGAQLVVLAWVLAATALGQAAGWAVEGVRRTARGVLVVRIGAGAVVVGLAALHLAGLLAPLARSLPTTWLADTAQTGRWPLALGVLLLLTVIGLVLGARPAAWALGLPPREELRVQSGVHEARHVPEPRWGSADRALLRRLDRGSVWRSVGMRRGLMVLGIGPGLVALLAGLEWGTVLLLPGLTALLFTGLTALPWAWAPAVVALPFLAWSTRRLLRARRRWSAGDERARVVLTVAAV